MSWYDWIVIICIVGLMLFFIVAGYKHQQWKWEQRKKQREEEYKERLKLAHCRMYNHGATDEDYRLINEEEQ